MIVRVEIEEDDLTKEGEEQLEADAARKIPDSNASQWHKLIYFINKIKGGVDKPDYLRINNKFIRQYVEIERVENTPGSVAGAGSGDFHHYRLQRRKEKYRMAKMQWLFKTVITIYK